MNLPTHARTDTPRRWWLHRGLTALLLLTMAAGPVAVTLRLPAGAAVAQAPTCTTPGSFTLDVREFVDVTTPGAGVALADYTYIVNEDNAGDPYAVDPVDRPGRGPMSSYSPIVAAGDETAATLSLPDGRYLVTVRAAGYKIWGRHVRLLNGCVVEVDNSLPAPPPTLLVNLTGDVLIELVAEPLPLAQLKVYAFRDNVPVNSAPTGAEAGLAGFHVVIHDAVGEVTVDWFGNPLCTQYYPPGVAPFFLPPHPTHPGLGIDTEGNPVPIPQTGGKCVTGPDPLTESGFGSVTIPWLPHGQYDTFVVPPDGEGWIQTSTFEGTKAIEHTRIMEGDDGFGATYEAAREGLVLPTAFWFGFVQECQFGNTNDSCPTNEVAGTATVNGSVVTWTGWPPFEQIVYNEPVYRPWIALSNIGADEMQVYTGRGNADGSFSIPNVPAGTYMMAIWDEPLDYIITYRALIVEPGDTTVDMGTIGIFRWFGWVSGYVFMDDGLYVTNPATGATAPIPGLDQDGNPRASNGIRDCVDPINLVDCERGIPQVDLDIRFRDGTIKSATFTDATGYYEYAEELAYLFKFVITEVGFGRFARTGHSWHNDLRVNNPFGDHDGDSTLNNVDPDLAEPTVVSDETGGGLLLNMYTLEGKRNVIDWGKLPYDTTASPPENGGISGVVIYATTRNEFDARLAAAEDYEPGIPNVTVNLYQAVLDPVTGDPVFDPVTGEAVLGTLLNSVSTDAWEQPGGCDVTNRDGLLLSASTAAQQNPLYGFTYTFDDILNPPGGPQCIEYPLLSNEVQPGAFDGGYAFETACTLGVLIGEGCVLEADAPLPPGDYIIEVIPPDFHQILKEEDQNTDEGNELTPIPLLPPPPCVGPLHLVVDSRNPFDGQDMPLCNRKLVTVQAGQNPAADFFLFTDGDTDPTTSLWSTTDAVPIPGRIFGLVADDFVRDVNPNSLWYGEERAVPYAPVGIRDFVGRLITTIHTDENGFYEVLLPGPFQADCPIPSGVCPNMYVLRVNDPGDLIPAIPPDAPINNAPNANYKRTYLTEPAPFHVWPGKMTKADTPVDPIGWWSCAALNNLATNPLDPLFGQPVDVEFFSVSRPYGPAGFTFGIYGLNFGNVQGAGSVTLDGVAIPIVAWSNEVITATVAGPPGPRQMLVNTDAGTTSLTGLTFHVTGPGYNPNIVTVTPPAVPGTPVIQPAIDTAPLNSLIVVAPGGYHESPILHRAVRLQGHGPGGLAGLINPLDPITAIEDPRVNILGSFIEGRFFENYRAAWLAHPALNPSVSAGAALTVLGDTPGEFTAASYPLLDGFWITGGRGDVDGGGVNVHGNARFLRISNNILENNSGVRGGGIGVGRLMVTDSNNDNVRISYNRLVNNGSLAQGAGIAVFGGANGYRINNNDICGNYSGEYGGGIAHFGLSLAGGPFNDTPSSIDHNHIHLNDAFDEGGGILIAGNSNDTTNDLGLGSGPVDIRANRISGNYSDDDGGGIRLLRALDYSVNIVNNMIQQNMAADHGGAIALDDSSNVNIVNNTIARNFSTSTAVDSIRVPSDLGPLPRTQPRGAGLTTELHSTLFAPAGVAPDGSTFSDPVLFNNIFESNQSFFFDPNVTPIVEGGAAEGIVRVPLIPAGPGGNAADPLNNSWDLEVIFDGQGNGCFTSAYNMFASDAGLGVPEDVGGAGVPSQPYGPGDLNGCTPGLLAAPGNTVGQDSMFLRPRGYEEFNAVLSQADPNFISVQMWRAEGGEGFISAADFHLQTTSPAIDAGAQLWAGVLAPCDDYDDDGRPMAGAWDIGADEQPGLAPCSVRPNALYFSTLNNVAVPDVAGPYDDADIYIWDGFDFARLWDARVGATGLPAAADVDALMVVDADTFYLSFNNNGGVDLPGPLTAADTQDEDIVLYDTGTWSVFFDGSDVGLTTNNEDVDAFDILPDGSVVVSILGNGAVPGVSGVGNEDLIRCVGTFGATTTCTWSPYFDGSDVGFDVFPFDNDVDGAAVSQGGIYLTTEADLDIGGLSVEGGDVFVCVSPTTGPATACTNFTLFFDASANAASSDVDAIDVP